MAIAISEPTAPVASSSNTNSYALGAFTPAANALLVCLVFADGTNGGTAPSMSGGGLTWYLKARTIYDVTDTAFCFIAQAPASPASCTPTFDCTGDNATGCIMMIFSVTGHNVLCPVAQVVTAATTAANPTSTRAAANTNNGYIAGFGNPNNPPTSTPPMLWTEIADTGHTVPAAGASGAFRAGGETSTSVTFTAASGAYGLIYIEINEASVGGRPPPFENHSDTFDRGAFDPRRLHSMRQDATKFSPLAVLSTLTPADYGGRFPESIDRSLVHARHQPSVLIVDPKPIDFPVTSAKALAAFWIASFTGSPWRGHISRGTSANRLMADATTAPAVGASYNGRTAAKFSNEFPASLALTGWLRGSYGGSPWAGTASIGTSSSESASEATNPPAVGTAVNGFTPADFDGTNDLLTANGTLDTYFNAAAGSWACLFYADTAASPAANVYDDEQLWADGGGAFLGCSFTTSGVKVYIHDGAFKIITTACSTGAWHLLCAKWNGTTLFSKLDSASWTSLAAGSAGGLGNTMRLGINYSGAQFFDGKILKHLTADSVLSDADFDDIRLYVNSRYGLAL